MKIRSVEPILLRIPFEDGGRGTGMTPTRWHAFDMVLVRIEADNGLVGWGEAFAYYCARPVAALVTDLFAPLLHEADCSDPAALNLSLQKRTALFGRYGLTTFALSGIDIALWDLKAKAQGQRLVDLLTDGRPRCDHVTPYASLVRYGEPDLAARFAEQARAEGYTSIKMHEIDMAAIRAARAVLPREISFTVDVNCSWTEAQALDAIPELKALNTLWLEEPVFPPEDWDQLRRLGRHGLAIAAGENACTAQQFQPLLEAVTYAQPSVIKVGGITECLRIDEMARRRQATLMLHSPYFGPGYHATLHLAGAMSTFGLFEHLYVTPEALLAREPLWPQAGRLGLPTGLGLGFEPDPAVIERFRVDR